jgi:hypothetical protein
VNSLTWYGRQAVAPTAAEEAILRRAVRISRALGVTFAPGQCEIRFWAGSDWWWGSSYHEPRGLTFKREKPVRIWIRRGFPERDTFCTIAHELRHAFDALNPPGQFAGDSEERAEAFAQRALKICDEEGRSGSVGIVNSLARGRSG